MSRTLDYPRVTDQLLQEVVRRILSVGTPHKIGLFGSQARGEARPDSDLDLLIVEESDLPRYKRSVPCTHNLEELQQLCIVLVPTLALMAVDLAELTPYAVQLRYDFEFWPDQETAEQALSIAERVRTAVLTAVPQEAHP